MMTNLPVYKVGEYMTVQKRVEESDTALNYGSGNLDNLFATPSLVALMIRASTKLIDDRLEEGFISVGKKLSVDHEKASVLGATVTLKVTIVEQIDNKINLTMEAFDETGLVSTGTHTRYIVNKGALLDKATDRSEVVETINV